MLGVSYKWLVVEDYFNVKSWHCASKHKGLEGGVMNAWEQVAVIFETIMGPESDGAGCDQSDNVATLLKKIE